MLQRILEIIAYQSEKYLHKIHIGARAAVSQTAAPTASCCYATTSVTPESLLNTNKPLKSSR